MSDIKQHERKSRNEIFFYHIISSNIIFEKKLMETYKSVPQDSRSVNLGGTRNLEVDGCPSKKNLFAQSALSMKATHIFSIR